MSPHFIEAINCLERYKK